METTSAYDLDRSVSTGDFDHFVPVQVFCSCLLSSQQHQQEEQVEDIRFSLLSQTSVHSREIL